MKWFKGLILFLIGGGSYYTIEILWRGYSHPSMFILGGVCFILIGLINEKFSWKTKLWKQQLIATSIVTTLEFASGVILNLLLGLNIWNYSNLPFNLFGQVCLQYTILWFFLSLLAIILDDYIRHWFFGEEKPYYKFI